MYIIYFHNWWGGFFNGSDANNINFFKNLLEYTKLKDYEISKNYRRSNILIDAGKSDITKRKNWNVKINFIGEPVLPDSHKYDIVLTGSRKIENCVDLPVSVMYTLGNNYFENLKTERKITSVPGNFCCFIVSNPKCEVRNKMFHLLNKYKKVNSGGGCFNNIGGRISGGWSSRNHLNYISTHKFMICFENTKMENYSTEKIVNAYLSRVIPIYWSSHYIKDYFNPDSMLFLEDETEEAYEKLINKIIELDNDDEKYLEFINRPVFNEENLKYWEENYSYKSIGEKINKLLKE